MIIQPVDYAYSPRPGVAVVAVCPFITVVLIAHTTVRVIGQLHTVTRSRVDV